MLKYLLSVMKKKLLIFFVIGVIGFLRWNYLSKNTTDEYSQEVVVLCEKEAQKTVRCDPDCVDGINEVGYFDGNKYSKSDFKGWASLSPKAEEASFAIRTEHACGDCQNTFELKKNETLIEVSCEEFYQAIEDKNKGCDNCVEKLETGCC